MDLNSLMKEAQTREHVELVLLEARGHREFDEDDISNEARQNAKGWLRDHDLITHERYSGNFDLSYDGQILADKLHESRTNGERRWDLVMREILAALDTNRPLESVAEVDGAAVTDKEREVIYNRLERWGLAELHRDWGNEVVQVVPKPALAEALGVTGSLKDHFEGQAYLDQRVSNQTNISGGIVGGTMTGGSNNTMQIQQTITPLEAAGIKARVDEILQHLEDVEGAEELARIVQGVREEVDKPEATKSSVKAKATKAISLISDLSSIVQTAPVIAPVVPMLKQLVGML